MQFSFFLHWVEGKNIASPINTVSVAGEFPPPALLYSEWMRFPICKNIKITAGGYRGLGGGGVTWALCWCRVISGISFLDQYPGALCLPVSPALDCPIVRSCSLQFCQTTPCVYKFPVKRNVGAAIADFLKNAYCLVVMLIQSPHSNSSHWLEIQIRQAKSEFLFLDTYSLLHRNLEKCQQKNIE